MYIPALCMKGCNIMASLPLILTYRIKLILIEIFGIQYIITEYLHISVFELSDPAKVATFNAKRRDLHLSSGILK